jgi:hypothetical protein
MKSTIKHKLLLFLAFAPIGSFAQTITLWPSSTKQFARTAQPQKGKQDLVKEKPERFTTTMPNGEMESYTKLDLFAPGFTVQSGKGIMQSVKLPTAYKLETTDTAQFGVIIIDHQGNVSGLRHKPGKRHMRLNNVGIFLDTVRGPKPNEEDAPVPETRTTPAPPTEQTPAPPQNPDGTWPIINKTVTDWYEMDNALYKYFGTIQKSSDWMIRVFACDAAGWLKIGIKRKMSGLKVWNTIDPYTTYSVMSQKLNDFEQKTDPSLGSFRHLRTKSIPGGGGIAHRTGACSAVYSPVFRASLIQFDDTTFNKNGEIYSWIPLAEKHEKGHCHNLFHEHYCGHELSPGVFGPLSKVYYPCEPYGGKYCYTAAEVNGNGGGAMSYRYVNFGYSYMDFHPNDARDARNDVFNATCIPFDGPQPPTCTDFQYGAPYGPCVNGQRTHTVIGSSPTGCTGGNPTLTESCTVPPTTSVTVSTNANGKVVSGQPSYLSDGNETTRYVVQDTLILTWSNSTMLKMDTLTLISGYKASATAAWTDFNDFTGIWVDGVRLVRSVVPAHSLRVPVGVSGRVFVVKTTGKVSGSPSRRTSRVCEVNLR